jgi:HipA-like C-terminal domain
MNYGELLKAVQLVTRHQAYVEKMVRRMIFNAVAYNRNDHLKQHAFLMDAGGRWTLAPAYDLTFSHGPGGQGYLTVGGRGTDIGRTAIASAACDQGVDAATIHAMAVHIATAVSWFAAFAREYGVSRRTTADVRAALDRQLAMLFPPAIRGAHVYPQRTGPARRSEGLLPARASLSCRGGATRSRSRTAGDGSTWQSHNGTTLSMAQQRVGGSIRATRRTTR